MALKKRMLADVLWDAANERLEMRDEWGDVEVGGHEYSCEAVAEVVGAYDLIESQADWHRFATTHPAMVFLRSLGCKTRSMLAFDRFSFGEERQGVRYMWLLLAMHVAEDEGIEIEVER